MKTAAMATIILVLLGSGASAQSRIRAGCEAIADVYEKQAFRSFREAEQISKWVSAGDYRALCSFYQLDYPEAQAAYIGSIQELKKKGVCWDKKDQASLDKNLNTLLDSISLRKDYCAKVTTGTTFAGIMSTTILCASTR